MPLILLFAAIGPALAYSGTWVDVTNDWAPCTGYNHYSFSKSNLGPGKFNGYSQDQANGDVLCNPDTTEHEVNAGMFSNATYTATSTGYLTVKAVFQAMSTFGLSRTVAITVLDTVSSSLGWAC